MRAIADDFGLRLRTAEIISIRSGAVVGKVLRTKGKADA
jgi:hypothetical protein